MQSALESVSIVLTDGINLILHYDSVQLHPAI